MLYPANRLPFSEALFQNPTSEYRGTPFWAWNCKMDEQNIEQTLDALKVMGLGGAHLHCRTGLDVPYLSDRFFELIRHSTEYAKKLGMLTWLYDEDRWPSGFGGGFVTEGDAFRARFLLFAPYDVDARQQIGEQHLTSHAGAVRSGKHQLLARYAVALDDNGYLAAYHVLKDGESANQAEHEWFAYLEVSGGNPWFNNQAYVDTLNKKAMDKFVEITHEAYLKAVGDEFGKCIPSMFTDEPQFSRKEALRFAGERSEVTLPFTDDLEETFRNTYGQSLIEHVPELFWDLPDGKVSTARYQYHDHVAERFAQAFADNVGTWCDKHGIALTGHMMEEQTLLSQTAALGDAMRSLRACGIPGIDMLCDRVELSTAKQAQSVAHQYGREGMLSELYGVTDWDFDFRGHKRQGDWQAALGVTVRVHHLTWTSMAGEAKRDYPACIGPQSPWYRSYPYIENYFARVNTLLTRGKPLVKVGVVHPVESYWLRWGPGEQTGAARDAMQQRFEHLNEWLIHGLIDFDFIAESLLPTQNKATEAAVLQVGEMGYEAVVVPGCETIRSTTLDALEAFAARGGQVVFLGSIPHLVDAAPSVRAQKLAGKCACVPYEQTALLDALAPQRLIEARGASGYHAPNLAHQFRADGDARHLFLCHVNPPHNDDIPTHDDLTIRLQGEWAVTMMDAMTGEIRPLEAETKPGQTILRHRLYDHDSLLVTLSPVATQIASSASVVKVDRPTKPASLPINAPVTLEEPNVLLLDMPESRFDGGDWRPAEEILRVDNQFRKALGYPMRSEAFAQPWTRPVEGQAEHALDLRFRFRSELAVSNAQLALEDAADATITLNGAQQNAAPDGTYVDRSIQTVSIGPIVAGENELLVTLPYSPRRNVEAMYLLGNFSVRVVGREAVLHPPVTLMAFSDAVPQGLPFYGGNYTYHLDVDAQEGRMLVRAPKFRCPAMKISVDGEEKGLIALAPYELLIEGLKPGMHKLDITVFGNRVNTFGTVHNCDEHENWVGPNAWRSSGDRWSYEYQLRRTGLLKAPEVLV